MRGHEPALKMRRKGFRPAMVFIDAMVDHSRQWSGWPACSPSQAHVEILPDEMLSGLDFRFVVGLPVLLIGTEQRRVEAITAACVDAGARRVVASVVSMSVLRGEPVATVHSTTDTEVSA